MKNIAQWLLTAGVIGGFMLSQRHGCAVCKVFGFLGLICAMHQYKIAHFDMISAGTSNRSGLRGFQVLPLSGKIRRRVWVVVIVLLMTWGGASWDELTANALFVKFAVAILFVLFFLPVFVGVPLTTQRRVSKIGSVDDGI
jgi:hypothetical protein